MWAIHWPGVALVWTMDICIITYSHSDWYEDLGQDKEITFTLESEEMMG